MSDQDYRRLDLVHALRLRVHALARRMGGLLARADTRSQVTLWLIALFVGIVTGYAITLFRAAIPFLQTIFYGATDEMIHSVAASLPWYLVMPVPVLGGLVVGVILTRYTPDGNARGVADVIHATVFRGGRVDRRAGLASAAAALVTLSTGGSTGREGPAVHLGAVIASWVSEKLRAPDVAARDILGCAAAAAVSASFNAPIAGALFALEVVLRHFALHAFGPIVIASVAAAVISRLHHGDVTEFDLPPQAIVYYQELPAFMLLGILSGFVAVAMMRTIFFAEDIGDRVQSVLRLPNWLRPAVAGLLLGTIALAYPHIIGVGYETTVLALRSELDFSTAVVFAVVKVAAVALTFSGRMGGGIFSPSLMLGALTGTAFGAVAIALLPDVSGSQGLYAVAGTGAVAAAVLGAPISTTLIMFELTGDWRAALSVMVATSLATVVADRMVQRSFFLTQLARQGIRLALGPQVYLASTLRVGHVMRPRGAENGASESACWELFRQGAYVRRSDTLERALPLLDRLKGPFLPVMSQAAEDAEPELLGALFHIDALKAYARALEEELKEEHT